MAAPDSEHQDMTFRPTRELADGDCLRTAEFELQAIHTPGHASNHLCYRLLERNWVLTGDHIIAGSTVVINPPDGNMQDYLASLARIKALRPLALLPGHGDRIDDSAGLIDWIVAHRLEREARVLAAVRGQGGLSSTGLVPHVYSDVPESLYAWAERSLLAHLIKLEADGLVSESSGAWDIID
jgi:glyoxylase-like metal-dependent hydrolase (beta-lactamase superfamily II)